MFLNVQISSELNTVLQKHEIIHWVTHSLPQHYCQDFIFSISGDYCFIEMLGTIYVKCNRFHTKLTN